MGHTDWHVTSVSEPSLLHKREEEGALVATLLGCEASARLNRFYLHVCVGGGICHSGGGMDATEPGGVASATAAAARCGAKGGLRWRLSQ